MATSLATTTKARLRAQEIAVKAKKKKSKRHKRQGISPGFMLSFTV